MSIYQAADEPRPDEDFEPGSLEHLVPGVRGRLLDPRRTPVSVLAVWPGIGFVDIRIEGFEDEGATWRMPLEHAHHFQFELDGPRAPAAAVTEMEAAIERFAHARTIAADPADRDRTEARIAESTAQAAAWLDSHSRFLASGRPLPDPSVRRGDAALAADLEAWLRAHELWDIEAAFAGVFVSNPGSGEVVKGHRIVLATLGLADYHDGMVRDPTTFAGAWTHDRRAAHIVARMAFVRAFFDRLGVRSVRLWRGAAIEGRLRARPGRTFVSTSFDEAVARSHYHAGAADWIHVLIRQDVPVERLYMTYHETGAMNTVYLEAEAAVLARTGDGWP